MTLILQTINYDDDTREYLNKEFTTFDALCAFLETKRKPITSIDIVGLPK